MLLHFAGWAIIGIGIAAAFCAKREKDSVEEKKETTRVATKSHSDAITPGEFCDAIESIFGGMTILFDDSLRVRESGSNFTRRRKIATGFHIVDTFPEDEIDKILNGVAAARREGFASWKFDKPEASFSMSAVPVGKRGDMAVLIGDEISKP